MNNVVVGFIAFVGGAVLGSAVTYIYTKKHFETKVEEQVAEVRSEFDKYMDSVDKDVTNIRTEIEKEVRSQIRKEEKKAEVDNLEKAVTSLNYTKTNDKKGPYVIEQGGEDFGGYMAVSLDYYADGVLVDDPEVISDKDVDDIVGLENLALLSDTKPLIWVRNEERQVDYEIAYVDEDYYDEG